jgi:hypothetical protein
MGTTSAATPAFAWPFYSFAGRVVAPMLAVIGAAGLIAALGLPRDSEPTPASIAPKAPPAQD